MSADEGAVDGLVEAELALRAAVWGLVDATRESGGSEEDVRDALALLTRCARDPEAMGRYCEVLLETGVR